MISRLDRLFLLLDSGTSMVIKKSAAAQLGEVQKQHPNDLQILLAKLRTYLHSPNWDTRIAAGYAIDCIISNVPHWNPPGIKGDKESDLKFLAQLKFSDFNIQKVMESGVDLLASDGKQYDYEDIKDMNDKERISHQRYLLNKRLGLDLINTNLLEDDDLNHYEQTSSVKEEKDISEVINNELVSQHPLMKEKRKKIGLQEISDEPIKKKIKVEDSSSDLENEIQNQDWPLKDFSELLMNDLFSPVWEVRHGAATALREIVKHHGKGAGRAIDLPSHLMDQANQLWLKDLALRFISVLALDKLGDYISDQVVAPVRETVAQALGLTASLMDNTSIVDMLHLLLQLLQRPEWEARHGGMLGLKYCLAIRKDMNKDLVPLVFESIFQGLQDKEDDVSAVAAAALLPIAECLVEILPLEVPKVLRCLWDSLLELDDLTASTNSIVKLLSSLLSYPISFAGKNEHISLKELIPRLWPFLQHPSDMVRKSVVHALAMLSQNLLFKKECLFAILPDTLRLLFQQCLVETKKEILELIYKVWTDFIESSSLVALINATSPYIAAWLCFTMHPDRMPLDSNLSTAWLHVSKAERTHSRQVIHKDPKDQAHTTLDEMDNIFIGGKDLIGELPETKETSILQSRTVCSRLLAVLFHRFYNASPLDMEADRLTSLKTDLANLLVFHLNSKSALQRFIISLIVTSWAHFNKAAPFPDAIKNKLLEVLTDFIYFDELAIDFYRTQKDFQDFVAICKHYKLKFELEPGIGATLEQMKEFTENISSALKASNLKAKLIAELEGKRQYLLKIISETCMTYETWSIKVHSSIAGALIALKHLPEKLTPLIKPLMDSIKKEKNASLQQASAEHLVYLMEQCLGRSPCPNDKIIRNLVTLSCSGITPSSQKCEKSDDIVILTLLNMQKNAERQCFRRGNSVGRPPRIPEGVVISEDKEEKQAAEIQKRGASLALTTAAVHFGPKLFQNLPQLHSSLFNALLKLPKPLPINGDEIKIEDKDKDWDLVTTLRTLEVVGPFLHPELHFQLVEVLDQIVQCLELNLPEVRHFAARALGMASKVVPGPTMSLVLSKVLPNLDATSIDKRLGAIEGIACIIEELGIDVVPYLAALIVPLLGCMSDPLIPIRLLSTHCFASLVRLIPLEAGQRKSLNKKDFPQGTAEYLNQKRDFLDQLLDPNKLEPFNPPPGLISAELRPYQQQGVNWLAFLKRYRLHGVLCDDMGLGKTLQSLCMLASDHYIKELNGGKCPPSLVICPPTLTGHWIYEVKKFIKPGCLNPLHYVGTPLERIKLREKASSHNLIIASYDIVRNDIDFFESISWNFCILDEGHIIKNSKTKVSKALKQLKASHRIILTGTPIQNNVLELWSLFDFLMPGFLGTEKEFVVHYSRPILQSRDAKASTKEQEAGALAMESLHRQVLPFLLRRKKEDVLKDLPPKIIQDFYCELSPLQIRLYEDFSASKAKSDILQQNYNSQRDPHVFEALQYLRNVCNHPKLVLKPSHPEYKTIIEELTSQNSSLSEIEHAAKLMALKQLLQDCGICADNSESVINQHRVLIFCQLKSMLDIIENDLFKKHMPKLSYLRLDGSVPQGLRIEVAEQFNHDPSIDVFLLTTHIGGLGLNLTGADTVIFVEHDWNPMKDFQAMDRAHRIGQKKVVNIYRLITRGTLEEKIMGLQEFKLKIANTVISTDNSQLHTMGTGDLLDLFTFNSSSYQEKASKDSKNSGLSSLLKELPELWSTEQYDSEYDLANFLSLLKDKNN